MAVYGEWHWSCDLCDDASGEPWGEQEDALIEYEGHLLGVHGILKDETA